MVDRRTAIQMFVNRLSERSALSTEEAGALHDLHGTLVQNQANLDIVSPGQVTDHACLVVDGLVGRFGQIYDGRRQITALHLAGEMCDLDSVALPTVRWSLQALSPSTTLRISHRDLRRVATAYPAIAEAFWRDCVIDASILSQWVINVGRREAKMRLAHLICEMAKRMENAGLGTRDSFRLDATQSQLADALGLTSVHVNRTLKALRNEGVVELRRRSVTISDWERLAQFADFDAGYLQLRPLAGNQPTYRLAS